jgi:hypothetical protein
MQAFHRASTLLRMSIVAVAAAAVVGIQALPAEAQSRQQRQPAQQQQAEPEDVQIEQIALTQGQIDAFIATEKAIQPITAKLKGNAQPGKQAMAQMEAAAKKNGFKDFDEYGDVGANIGLVFGGIDPDSKKYDPAGLIKREIAAVQADRKIPAKQKQQIVKDLQEAAKDPPKLEHPGNAELVARNYDRLRPVMGGPGR